MKTALFICLLLAGCTQNIPGVEITEEERKACAVQGCTVWTEQQLENVARHFYQKGKRSDGGKSI